MASNSSHRLFRATEAGNVDEFTRILLEDASLLNAVEKGSGFTPLMLASHYGHTHVCRKLLEAGASVNATNADDDTAFSLAIARGHLPICKALLEYGFDVSNPSGGEHLRSASRKGWHELCEGLIRRGADVNSRGRNGDTPIMHAASAGHVRACEILLMHAADPNAATVEGNTALMLSAQNGWVGVCMLLLDYGADATAQNCGQRTVLDFAASSRLPSVCARLIQHGADVNARRPPHRAPPADTLSNVPSTPLLSCIDPTFQRMFLRGLGLVSNDKRTPLRPLVSTRGLKMSTAAWHSTCAVLLASRQVDYTDFANQLALQMQDMPALQHHLAIAAWSRRHAAVVTRAAIIRRRCKKQALREPA